MNTSKFNKYLKKIKSFENLVEDLANLSFVEQDLLKDYIKKLYESVLESDEVIKPEKKEKKNKKKVVEKHTEIIEEEIKIVKEEPKKEKVDKGEHTESIPVEDKIQEKEIVKPVLKVSDELLELFELKSSNELLHKLSLSPIKSLTRAFSINERIFTVKELFAGNKEAFEKTLGDLDNLNSLEEAKNYLVENIVDDFGWDEPKMIKKVEHFVKTVKRRYL